MRWYTLTLLPLLLALAAAIRTEAKLYRRRMVLAWMMILSPTTGDKIRDRRGR